MRRALALATLALAAACGGSSSSGPPPTCATAGCPAGQYCESVAGASVACFAPVIVSGAVLDATSATSVAGARVVALDPNRAPTSTVAVTPVAGTYQLKVRSARDASGRPTSSIFLRADAQGYETFPGGLRPALPVDLSTASGVAGSWVVSGPLTLLRLFPLAGGGTASLHGSVAAAPNGRSPLVVAEPAPGDAGPGTGVTGIAGTDGTYAIFNLRAGTSYVVKAYAQGTNWTPATTGALAAGDQAVSQLALAGPATASFGGNIIANNSPNPAFKVTLAVDATYLTTLDRGDSPPGLTVDGSFGNPGYTFTGVPDGTYRVLAAYGLDGDVRDVSGTGNTSSPLVTVTAGVAGTPPGFKIIPAVDLVSIGGVGVGTDPIVVTSSATPTFHWVRGSVDAQSATYRVLVFDVFGDVAYSADQGAVSGDNAATYAGTALTPGVPYQLRILAIKEPIPVPAAYTQQSQTEDLAGVFTYQP